MRRIRTPRNFPTGYSSIVANRAFLIHGFGGRPEEGWRPWLKRELEARDWEVSIPAMPDTDHPRQTAWTATIAQLVGTPDAHTYLVGHSLGATAILRYLESLPIGQSVAGAMFVAGPTANHRQFPEIDNFFSAPFDWPTIAARSRRFVALHSDNDEYVPVADAAVYGRELQAELIVLSKMGHFSQADGCRVLPIVLDRLLSMTRTT